MEEDTNDVKPDILEEKPDIKNLQENPKEDYVNHSDNNRHLKSEVPSKNLASKDILASKVKGQKFDGIEDIKCEVSDEESACLGSSQMHNEHLGGFEHRETEFNAQTLNCIISEVKTQTSGSLEHVEMEVNAKTLAPSLKLQGQVDSFGGIEHLKPELSDESFDDMTDDKPCIAALRASVAAYSVNNGREEMELEPFPNTEMLEPLYDTASNAQEADQESVENCRSDARDCKEMEIKKRGEHSDKGKSSGCPTTLNEFSQDAEQKKTTTIEVSPLQQEILHRETSTGGPFQCLWCPWVYFQYVDRERHMKRSHREKYVKLSQEKNSQHVKAFHQSNGLHACIMSSSAQSEKTLQTAHRRPSEVGCQARGDRTFIKTETSVDLGQLPQNEHAGWKIVSNDLSKQVPKRFCSLQKFKDNKECSKLISANKNNASSLFSKGSRHKRPHTGEKLYMCDVCGKVFRYSGSLSRHKRTHTGETPYKCDVCGKGFWKSGHLSVHKKTHTGETPYKCDVCGKGFGYISSLSVHMRSHTGEKAYKCDMCGKMFGYISSLTVHMRTHTGEKPYKCCVCGKSFGNLGHLFEHKRTHTGETPYICDVCGKGFGRSSHLSVHKKTHTVQTPYKCDVCGKGFGYSSGLSVHMKTHTVQTPYKCDVCGKGFGYISSLFVHMKTHTVETLYKCDVCGKGFGYISSLSVHMKTHTGETPYKCDVCCKGFRYSSSLSLHTRSHTGETPYKCDVCGMGFGYSGGLTVHMRSHTGETPYKCDVCGKGFGYSSSLSVHKRVHTGETPYKCDVCGKGFGYSSSLSVHKRVHTGETPYKCDVCGKGFGYSGGLSVHMRSHTGETPYKCDVCGKRFGQSGNLSMHKRTHTGETRYKCDVCGKRFRHSRSLSKHEKRTHLVV